MELLHILGFLSFIVLVALMLAWQGKLEGHPDDESPEPDIEQVRRERELRLTSDLWPKTARRLDLPLSRETAGPRGGKLNVIAGERHGFHIKCSGYPDELEATLEIDGRGSIPPGVVVKPAGTNVETDPQPFHTGDPEFDRAVQLSGNEAEVLALLDKKTRRGLARLIERRAIQVGYGRISASTVWLNAVPATLDRLLELARSLALSPTEVEERLARNAASDDSIAVRFRNLELLQQRYPESASETIRAAFASDDRAFRLIAAMVMGEQGLDVVADVACTQDASEEARLLALRHLWKRFPSSQGTAAAAARCMADDNHAIRLTAAFAAGEAGLDCVEQTALDERVRKELRLEALDYLAGASRAEVVMRVVKGLLLVPDPELREAAIEQLGRPLHDPLLGSLETLMDAVDDDTAISIVDAVDTRDSVTGEILLMRLLSRGNDRVKLAAVRALGRVGTTAAVLPLLDLARGLLVDAEVKRASRQAVTLIQSRVGDVGGGSLTLSTTAEHEGGLSTADDAERQGGLSLETEAESDR